MDRDNIAGVAAGSAIAILVWLVKEFAKIEVPAEIQVAAALLVNLVVTHFVPRKTWTPQERAQQLQPLPITPGEK